MNIYVGNLEYALEEKELEQAFESFGEVESVRIIRDRETGRAKGFGFVEMTDAESANAAIEQLNGEELNGRQLVVNEAKPQQRREFNN